MLNLIVGDKIQLNGNSVGVDYENTDYPTIKGRSITRTSAPFVFMFEKVGTYTFMDRGSDPESGKLTVNIRCPDAQPTLNVADGTCS